MDNFSYRDRLTEIEKTIGDYTQLKQLENNGLFLISKHLLKTIESSLVIAIYSLSEQMLKNKIYRVLEVQFEEENQTPKDMYILKQMPPDRYAVTPNLRRIKQELELYYPQFELYTPKIVTDYKESYEKLVAARHDYAHANYHTENIDFESAKKFVEYLNVQYDDIDNYNYIHKIKHFYSLLNRFTREKNNKDFQTFESYFEVKSGEVESVVTEIEDLYSSDDCYDIDYLNDIYEPLKESYRILVNITEESFSDDIEEFKILFTDI
ncbi:hypothetical protein HZZ02_05530 [Streptococcus danieliae]|nr:hypothetical protein [Streptococcus danieliae]